MTASERADEINQVADVIGAAIAKHYGGTINVYATLAALSTVAAGIIKQAPTEALEELLEAWDEVPAYARAQVKGLN